MIEIIELIDLAVWRDDVRYGNTRESCIIRTFWLRNEDGLLLFGDSLHNRINFNQFDSILISISVKKRNSLKRESCLMRTFWLRNEDGLLSFGDSLHNRINFNQFDSILISISVKKRNSLKRESCLMRTFWLRNEDGLL